MTTSTDTTALDLLRAGTAPKFVAEATGMPMSEVVALAEVHGLTPGAVQVPVLAMVPRQRTATPATAPAPAKDNTKVSSVTALLSWAEAHDDKRVRAEAERARTLLKALHERQLADREITALAEELAGLDQRRLEVQARLDQLQPPAKKKRTLDYDPKAVRAWAAANGHEVAPIGLPPRAVVDAWRAATNGDE